MTVDLTAQPGVFRIGQNGSASVVSGTTLTVESGGTLRFEAGSTLVNLGTASVNVESISSSATAFSALGVTLFGTTATGASYNLSAPTVAGQSKYLIKTVHGATTTTETVLATGSKILGGSTVAAGTSVITFANVGTVHLISTAANSWAIVATPAAKTEVSYS